MQEDTLMRREALRRNPIPPTNFDPDDWYQVREFVSTLTTRGYLRMSRTAFLEGVSQGRYPAGRKVGHQRLWWGRQIEALKHGRDWRDVAEPQQVTR